MESRVLGQGKRGLWGGAGCRLQVTGCKCRVSGDARKYLTGVSTTQSSRKMAKGITWSSSDISCV